MKSKFRNFQERVSMPSFLKFEGKSCGGGTLRFFLKIEGHFKEYA